MEIPQAWRWEATWEKVNSRPVLGMKLEPLIYSTRMAVPISRNLIEISILCTHQQYNWKYAYNNTRYVIWPTHANINITIMTRHTTFTAKVLLVFFHFLLYHDTLHFVQEPFRRVELRDVLQAIPPFSRRQIPRITKVFGTSMPWIVLSR